MCKEFHQIVSSRRTKDCSCPARSTEYVELENKRFFPTDVGKLVSGFLTNHFADYVDYEFTAHLEDELDAISRGEAKWIKVLGNFWVDFEKTVKNKETVSRGEVQMERAIGIHPKSGKPVSIRMGRYGPYVIIGDIESEEKPSFHGIPPGMKMDEITIEDVIEITGHSYQTAMGYYRRINTQMMRDTLSHRDLRTILKKNKIKNQKK